MKILLIQVGKTEDSYLKEGIDKYLKRLKHYINFETITIPTIKKGKNLKPKNFKSLEAESILKKIPDNSFVVLLDEKGKSFKSIEFADFMQKKMNQGCKLLVFVIGGAYGFDDAVYNKANFKLSLSSMTFSHQLIRLIFCEQIYRGFSIIKNEPYHNE